MQAKDRELAQAQQQLREKVSSELYSVCVVTRGPPDCRRLSLFRPRTGNELRLSSN